MVNFNSYVSLPEGIYEISPLLYGIIYGLYTTPLTKWDAHPSMNLLSIFGITKIDPDRSQFKINYLWSSMTCLV